MPEQLVQAPFGAMVMDFPAGRMLELISEGLGKNFQQLQTHGELVAVLIGAELFEPLRNGVRRRENARRQRLPPGSALQESTEPVWSSWFNWGWIEYAWPAVTCTNSHPGKSSAHSPAGGRPIGRITRCGTKEFFWFIFVRDWLFHMISQSLKPLCRRTVLGAANLTPAGPSK